MMKANKGKFFLLLTLCGLFYLTTARGSEKSLPVLLSTIDRGTVVSPDSEWQICVWGEKDEVPWIMLESRAASTKIRIQVWPITSGIYVLWSPDSKAFAFTDARFEDDYFLFVDHLTGYLNSEVMDLTSTVEDHFSAFAGKRYEILKWYIKPLLWVREGELLVGIDCVTAERISPPPQHQPVQNWFRGYIVDVAQRKIIQDLDETELKTKFKIDLRDEKW
jgi:hypothetical protein